MKNDKKFTSFNEFYPFYLSEHKTVMCRRLHVLGTSLACLSFLFFLFTWNYLWLILMLAVGYGFAWIGHFVYEKNKPATFRYPLYSLMGDFVMFWQILRGKLKI
ncbi:Mpo1-like protein [Legionella bozemanae]|uniref:Mpo1-like protein n=1 Tax=Legionella bozemanae TaxID=447 RepID=UPI00399D05F8